ncbi:MAG: hypothetical protein CW716_07985 [Candidatus Bathyarchaeum sp.]|nr:MAG: hypothetical protein CW716_07985 [Candidatus Bathyarchaeum sp.]
MKGRTLTICRAILSIILASVVAWSISVGNSISVIIAILIALVVTILLRRKDERILVDERIQLINEKSSIATVRVFIVALTLVGAALLALDNSGFADLSQSAFTLLYASCALMIVNMIFGIYYRRKYGG